MLAAISLLGIAGNVIIPGILIPFQIPPASPIFHRESLPSQVWFAVFVHISRPLAGTERHNMFSNKANTEDLTILLPLSVAEMKNGV